MRLSCGARVISQQRPLNFAEPGAGSLGVGDQINDFLCQLVRESVGQPGRLNRQSIKETFPAETHGFQ